MENIIRFEPLFATSDIPWLSRLAVQQVRAEAMEVLLNETSGRCDTIRDVAEETMAVTRLLLSDPRAPSSPILQNLAFAGSELCGDPVLLVTALISRWFREVSPYMTRSINSDPVSDMESRIGNLGLLSMLLTKENWEEVEECGSPKFQGAVLIANSVTTVVCGAYLMFRGSDARIETQWYKDLKLAPPSVCIWAFLKSSWRVARAGGKVWAHDAPGIPFSANAEEVRMRRDGRRLLVKIGRLNWEDPAYWHPCKQVPGSAWNKFFRNKNQPTFEPSRASTNTQIMHRIPNTAINYVELFERFYDSIYEGMDRRQFARVTLSSEESDLQHNRFAGRTGLWYPDSELYEEDASEVYNAFQDYLDVVPLAKRPTADAHGHLTLSFLASTVRALRFDREPEAIEEDFWVMVMGGTEAGEVLQ